jgi:hypothetical protein
MRIARWIPNTVNKHSEYFIFTDFPRNSGYVNALHYYAILLYFIFCVLYFMFGHCKSGDCEKGGPLDTYCTFLY